MLSVGMQQWWRSKAIFRSPHLRLTEILALLPAPSSLFAVRESWRPTTLACLLYQTHVDIQRRRSPDLLWVTQKQARLSGSLLLSVGMQRWWRSKAISRSPHLRLTERLALRPALLSLFAARGGWRPTTFACLLYQTHVDAQRNRSLDLI